MKIKFTWKHLDRSEATEEYANDKLGRLKKYVHEVTKSELSFEKVHGSITAVFNMHADKVDFNAHNTDKEIHACIDGIEEKLEHQLSHHHDKRAKH
ncbi:MAG: ribosome-associated translation inhibitor RaiA [Leptospiraceae bacterium]|jgi:putative sigma-54 modulation protein|nr:ribosome-associated translation inhibitor RaiA [Leptospiraceae bacterium]MBK7057318.1 ribosome-associated translation inhibitor RaiA [Leptospiraceae bacterium]MBK9503711.1 ribosome-associated translation inhibitor RaiA [Leptospiraceae bacterium]MBL0265438.1 ribosome-associated translation inhibitor RaiA [Leptospiraceae bacterium]MBP6740479.1 ribosome-associated translation inhibitor RaiA [Leptospiraceae bacterium]